MPTSEKRQDGQHPAAWALDHATRELYDESDSAVVVAHAWDLMRAAQDLEDERHDGDDDPDQGGEA
ncbi:hypothetical protein [Pedococcus sp. 5OH_020]|uniref:hypothetical protein n=1 Tax=Pedococcus sp. 5OH_020 TaxID=2989814 RepID=UPI0022E9F6F3|nr:hypothetical protein [Pedococcus sp. 5OH_020]